LDRILYTFHHTLNTRAISLCPSLSRSYELYLKIYLLFFLNSYSYFIVRILCFASLLLVKCTLQSWLVRFGIPFNDANHAIHAMSRFWILIIKPNVISDPANLYFLSLRRVFLSSLMTAPFTISSPFSVPSLTWKRNRK